MPKSNFHVGVIIKNNQVMDLLCYRSAEEVEDNLCDSSEAEGADKAFIFTANLDGDWSPLKEIELA